MRTDLGRQVGVQSLEAFVETQVVSDGVLPALPVVPVVGELVHDEVVHLA